MQLSSFLTALALLAIVPGVGAAQGPDGGGMGGGVGGYGGHHRGGGQRSDIEGVTIDPVVWNGPPAVVDLPPKIQLSTDQQSKYAALHDTFMVATKRVRDQSEATRQIVYGGPGSPHGSSATAVEDYKEQALYLSQKQDLFDQRLEAFFSKDQMKEYQKWRKAERKRAEAEQRSREEGTRGHGRPPD